MSKIMQAYQDWNYIDSNDGDVEIAIDALDELVRCSRGQPDTETLVQRAEELRAEYAAHGGDRDGVRTMRLRDAYKEYMVSGDQPFYTEPARYGL